MITKVNQSELGFATLPTIMALTILILAVVSGMAAWTVSESLLALGQQQAQQAYLYADAGAKDALTRIARAAGYTCATTDCYQIDMIDGAENGCSTNNGCGLVTVSAADGSVGNPKIITSKGRVKNNLRRIQVDVLISTNGEITSASWQELNN